MDKISRLHCRSLTLTVVMTMASPHGTSASSRLSRDELATQTHVHNFAFCRLCDIELKRTVTPPTDQQ